MTTDRLPHLFVEGFFATEKYTAKQGFGPDYPLPARDRSAHGNSVKSQLEKIRGENEQKRHHVTRCAYGVAIRLACDRAGITPWTPHQLRHALAIEVANRTQSIEHAAAAIGDTVETAARHYVHLELDPQEVMRRDLAREHG